MSNGKSVRKKLLSAIIAVIIVLVGAFLGIDVSDILEEYASTEQDDTTNNTLQAEDDVEGKLIVTMIDVGQADCFLYEQNGKVALIDCGEEETADFVIDFLKKKGITKLDYLIISHPHSDHAGGAYKIITSLEVEKVLRPQVDKTKITSIWYGELIAELNTVYVKGKEEIPKYNVEYIKEGDVYELGEATITVLEQFTEYKSDLNNYSAIIKISFGEIDIITTGDAEAIVEKELLKSGKNIEAEILKVGHHGSISSTTDEFLDAVSPEYALISAGVGNIHDHPEKTIIKKFEDRGIEVYRTDESGTVVITITADDVSFSAEPGSYADGIEIARRYAK